VRLGALGVLAKALVRLARRYARVTKAQHDILYSKRRFESITGNGSAASQFCRALVPERQLLKSWSDQRISALQHAMHSFDLALEEFESQGRSWRDFQGRCVYTQVGKPDAVYNLWDVFHKQRTYAAGICELLA
jgi:hypothetical protein